MRLPIRSNEEAVKFWLRDYSSDLACVGIRLGLTPTQQSELEHRLVAVCPGFDKTTAAKRSFAASALVDRAMDPIKRRWLHDQASRQGDTWAGY
jgi:hypothetical protein